MTPDPRSADPLTLDEVRGDDPSRLRELRAILDALYGIAVIFLFVFVAGCLAGVFVFGCQSIASLAPGVR